MVHNEIFIRTDRGQYVGGDVVYGTVYLNVLHPFTARSLIVEFQGYEKVFWEYEHTEFYQENGQQKTRKIVKSHGGENTFFKDAFTLISYPGGFPMGQWSYPFQYRLPDKLPGVFEKKKLRGLKLVAKIRYKIKATVDVSMGFDLKTKSHLVVHEKLDMMIQPKHHDKTIEVRTCCCVPRGPVRCECWMDKNAYMSGETAQLHVQVQNNSEVNVTHFTSKLLREINLSDGHGNTRTLRDVIVMRKYDGTVAHTNRNADIPLQLIGKKSKPIKPTSGSRMVNCSYSMMVEMDIPWAPDLEIYSPVTIYAPQSQAWVNWAAPSWVGQAQVQQVCTQLAIPKDLLDARMTVFTTPANANVTMSTGFPGMNVTANVPNMNVTMTSNNTTYSSNNGNVNMTMNMPNMSFEVQPTAPQDPTFTVTVKETTPLLG